jgi:hypothetical protein
MKPKSANLTKDNTVRAFIIFDLTDGGNFNVNCQRRFMYTTGMYVFWRSAL